MKPLVILLMIAGIASGAYYSIYRLYLKPQEQLLAEKARGPASPPPDPTLPEFQKRLEAQDSQSLLAARTMWADFIEKYPESSRIDEAKDYLGKLNAAIFLSPIESPEKTIYLVKPGDVITKVAIKLKTTPELLMRANNMQGNKASMLRIGQKIVVSPSEFAITISRRQKKVVLTNKGKFFKQYAIAVMPTPRAGGKINGKAAATPRPPKVLGKVADRIPWVNGQRVTFADKDFAAADFWITISPPGHSLYSEHPQPATVAGAPPVIARPNGGGYILAPEDLREIAALVKKNDPVTID